MHPIKTSSAENRKCLLKTGHWKLDIKTKKRKWSKGIYSIFELDENTPVLSLSEIKTTYVLKEDLPLFSSKVEQLNKGEDPKAFNYRVIVGDSIKYLYSSFCFSAYKNGVATKIGGYISDMTEWVILENKHRMISEQASQAFFSANPKGYIEDANKKAEELTGYTKEELLKLKVANFFTEEQLIETPLRFDLMEDGDTVTIRRMLKRKDSSTIPIEMMSKKITDGSYFAIVQDISERLDEELKAKKKSTEISEELDKANRMLIVQTLELSAKDNVLFRVKEGIEQLNTRNSQLNELIREIDRNISKQKTNEYFRLQFEEVHPGFFKRLSSEHTSLTSGDTRLCACLRMNMTSKEISLMAGVSISAVNKSRNRLRKKMQLPGRIDLVLFMQKI